MKALLRHDLLAVTLTVGANTNISKLNDNQAEVTIAIDPTKTTNLFAASMSWHGSILGKFDSKVEIKGVWKDHTPGLFVAFSTDASATWKSRIMATGGPTETNDVERSLPSADDDPQAVFDDFGNLYLTHRSSLHQFGTVTAGGGNIVTDNTRKWAPNMWASRIVTIRPGQPDSQSQFIKENTANTLTIAGIWTKNPVPGDAYEIVTGTIDQKGVLTLGNAISLLLSTDAGQNFQFLNLLDSGAQMGTPADYPAIATGGPGTKDKSVWLAWRGSNNMILAVGAPVTGKGAVGPFIPVETVNGSMGMGFPRIQVGPNGQVMVSFHTSVAIPTKIFVNVDDDGLGPNGFRATATLVTETAVVNGLNPPGFKIPAQPNRGITPQANLAWDRSGTYRPAPDGRVYIAFTDLFMLVDTDIYVKSSDDSGKTWSLPKEVSGLNFKSQFLPSISVDQKNGDVAVVWLDARNDPANVKVQLFGTVSGDGGNFYEVPVQIAKGQSDATMANIRQRGSSTGSTNTTLTDTKQKWLVNDYWRANFQVFLPATLESELITASTADTVTIAEWFDPKNPPPPGTAYQIRRSAFPRKIYDFDYGEYTGLAFQNGVFYAVWADNSNSTNDNPEGANVTLDVYTAAVTVTHNPGAGNVKTARGAPVRKGRLVTRR